MEIYSGFPTLPLQGPVFLTIGNFDGVHRGHQMLIAELVQGARAAGGRAGLLTFEPHPLSVLRPDIRILRLTSNEERADLLAALGLDFILELPFTARTAATPATDFMVELSTRLPLRQLWVGPDFALGRGREGDATRLTALGETLGYSVHITENYHWQGEPVRSTRIRQLLQEDGAVDKAAGLLGRPYRLWGEVVAGAQRGQKLGFPTANLFVPAERLVPAYGVYACWAWRDQTGYPAVANIGVRPSFDNGHPSVEAFLLDFNGDLYGETLGLSFVARLRSEKKFADIDALIAQIRSDSRAAADILAAPPTEVNPNAWEELAHTADWQIRVTGDTPVALFANAAAALSKLQEADFSRPIATAQAISAEADDYEGLLVNWLNRLLLAQELNAALFTHFEVTELSERGIRATAYGYRGAPAHTAIKAVTYYDLNVRKTAIGWEALLTFDV